jgi:mono/diheme cytochrome c family protein
MAAFNDARRSFMKTTWVAIALILLAGCKAGKPGKVENSVMGGIKRNITIGGKGWKNPIPYTDEAAKEGGREFQHHCEICHGLDGQNTGVPFAAKMSPPVADLASSDVQEYSDGQLKWIIENGIAPSGMPGWKGILDDDEMWKMVHYMRHLPPKGSLGDPPAFKASEHGHSH